MNSQGNNPIVEFRSVWKIFGDRTEEIILRMQDHGLSKTEVQAEFGSIVGVANANFSVNAGEIFCIMGLSGSGKSTLVRTINGLIKPTAGDIIVKNKVVNTLSDNEIREMRAKDIGMVFQHMSLWEHRNILDNVAFGLEIRGVSRVSRYDAARKALKKVQLEDWGYHYPDELSGGMQQRVGLARALTADPDILLMDEPFSALDPLIRRQLQDEFLKLSAALNKTTIFITHDLDEAIRLGDRIAIMNDGAIVQIGTPQDIITNPKDKYVEDFVRGISRLKLVYANKVMIPIETYKEKYKGELEGAGEVSQNANLDQLIDLFVEQKSPMVVVNGNEKIGVITLDMLLRSIQGKDKEDS